MIFLEFYFEIVFCDRFFVLSNDPWKRLLRDGFRIKNLNLSIYLRVSVTTFILLSRRFTNSMRR